MGFRSVVTFDLFCDGGDYDVPCTAQERFVTHEYSQVGVNCHIELDGLATLPPGWVMRRHHYTNAKEYFCPSCAEREVWR